MQNQPLILKIKAVSLQLKFRCRMRVECRGGPSTREVQSNSKGLYIFDQDLNVTLNNHSLDINFALITDKGAHYSGGILKITKDELKKNQISVSRMPLSKCIDKQAWCEFQIFCNTNLSDRYSRNSEECTSAVDQTPLRQKKSKQFVEVQAGQTQSQQSLSLPYTPLAVLNQREACLTTRKNYLGQGLNQKTDRIRSKSNLSPNRSATQRTSPELIEIRQKVEQAMEHAEFQSNRAKKIEVKMKYQGQKLKEEQEKRKSLEGIEHSYKLEIMKLKMGKAEGDKELGRKNSMIQQLSQQARKNKECQQMLSQVKQELKSKQTEVSHLKEKMNLQSKQLIKIKSSTQSELTKLETDLKKIKAEKDKVSKLSKEREDALEKELALAHQEISHLKEKLSALENDRDKNKKSAVFQSFAKEISQDNDKTTLALRKEIQVLRLQSEQQIQSLRKERDQYEKQLNQERDSYEKERTSFFKIASEKRAMEVERVEIETKLTQNKKHLDKLKSRCQEEINRNQILKDQNSKLKKKIEALLSQVNKVETTRIQEFQASQKEIQNLGELQRNLENRIQMKEEQLRVVKLQFQKVQKNEALMNNEMNSLREKEKNLKNVLSRKQTECLQMKGELETLSHKIFQKMETSSQHTPNFSFFQEQLEDQKFEKLVAIFESQQKQLQSEIEKEQLQNADFQSQISKLKDEIEKQGQREAEWRQQEHLWEKEVEKGNLEMTQLTKQIKEWDRKYREEEHKVKMITQRYEKEKRTLKASNEKCQNAENKVKVCEEEIQILKNEVQTIRAEKIHLSGEVQLAKAQLDYLEGERKKYVQTNEQLEFEIRTIKDQVSLASIKQRQLLEKQTLENKKHREEVIKYESKLKTLKLESQKFKQSLRKILIPFIQKDGSQELIGSKDQKKGLTLTNQLLFRLEEILKELSSSNKELQYQLDQTQKQLSQIRQQGILKTNQAQNAESTLKQKLSELISNYQSMKKLSEEREEASKKALEESSWNFSRISQELKNVKDIRDRLVEELNTKTIQLNQLQETKIEEQQKSLEKITTLDSTVTELSQQIQQIQNYCFRLQEKCEEVNQSKENNEIEKIKLIDRVSSLSKDLQGSKGKEEQQRKQILSLKQSLTTLQTQLQQLKLLNNTLEQEIKSYQKEKVEGGSLTRSLMKEKEQLLHQFLESQQKITFLEHEQFQGTNTIEELKIKLEQNVEQINSLKLTNQQMKVQYQTITNQLTKQSLWLKESEEKVKTMSELLSSKDQTIESILAETRKERRKFEQNINSLESSKKSQQQEGIRLKKEIKQLYQKEQQTKKYISQLCSEIELEKKVNRDMKNHLNISEQRFTQFLQNEKQLKEELEKKHSDLSDLKSIIAKMQVQISQKDLTNYELSSQKYHFQSQVNEQVSILHHKVTQQEEEIIKLTQLYQEVEIKLEESQQLLEIQAAKTLNLENQKEELKLTLATTSEQYSITEQQKKNAQSQLQQSQQTIKKIYSQLQACQRDLSEKMSQFQQQKGEKEKEIKKLKGENQSFKIVIKRAEEKCQYLDKELQEAVTRSQNEMEKNRKLEFSLKKIKESQINSFWNYEREIKKIITVGIRSLGEVGEKKAEEALKGVEEGVLDVLKRYKQF